MRKIENDSCRLNNAISMFSCLCDSKSSVWKQVSRLCVRFLAKILYRSLCCYTVNSLHWHCKLQIWNRPMLEHVPFKCLFNWLSFFKFVSLYWDIEITYLLAWKICLFPRRTMNVDEIGRMNLWQAPVKWTLWGALYG